MRVKRIHICYVTGNNTLGRPRVILQLLESLRQTMSGCFGQEIFDHKVSARSLGRSLREGGQPEVDMVVELYFIEAEMLEKLIQLLPMLHVGMMSLLECGPEEREARRVAGGDGVDEGNGDTCAFLAEEYRKFVQ